MSALTDPLLRAADRIDTESGECWLWLGQINNQGYGLLSIHHQKRAAHFVLYELLVEPVPHDLELDHLCRVRHCVNPDHLEPVTHAENQRRLSAAQLACRKAGHDWSDPKNVYVTTKGHRACRECRRVADRLRAPRRRAA